MSYYAADIGNFLPVFRDNLILRVNPEDLRMGPIGCPETSVRNYAYSLRNNSEESSSRLLRDRSLKLLKSHKARLIQELHDVD
jgi:hypothetical protein